MARIVRQARFSKGIEKIRVQRGIDVEQWFVDQLTSPNPPSQREMAEMLGVSLPTINAWLKRFGWLSTTTVSYKRGKFFSKNMPQPLDSV